MKAPTCPRCNEYPRHKVEDHTGDWYTSYCTACTRTIITYKAAQNRSRHADRK